jgi:hypothetical protein
MGNIGEDGREGMEYFLLIWARVAIVASVV